MKITLTIDKAHAETALRQTTREVLIEAAHGVGAVVVGQIVDRFQNSGDEEGTWPDLWVNDPDKLANRTRFKADVDGRKREVELAEKHAKRVAGMVARGTLTGPRATNLTKRAKRRVKMAKDHARNLPGRYGVNPTFRGGDGTREAGKPLLDTGQLRNSIRYEVIETPRGAIARTGSPEKRLLWHQFGFKTKGPNYIPITREARKGWRPDLVPDMDYIIARNGVTVPPRPTIRFTVRDVQDIQETVVNAAM